MTKPTVTYDTAVRSFNHENFAQLAAYPALRGALSDLCNQSEGNALAELLDAVRDMALTAPFADCCGRCERHPDYLAPDGDPNYVKPAWPHAVERDGDWLTCTYRCPRCSHVWTCGYSVSFPGSI
jgi:hypothetical protein